MSYNEFFIIYLFFEEAVLFMRLRDIREDHDLTQTAIAELLHIKQNTYSQYESGQRQIPIDLLVQLAFIYQTSTDYLLEITDESIPYPRSNRNIEFEKR